MVLDIQTVHHILKNTAVQNVNKPPFVYITDLTSTLNCIEKNVACNYCIEKTSRVILKKKTTSVILKEKKRRV
jgi:hypothetical protein